MREGFVRQLQARTGAPLEDWNRRVRGSGATDEASLRVWLRGQGVTGYPQNLLVMERFGYPDFFQTSSDEPIAGQYADRPTLRPILDALLARAREWEGVEVQARKTYVCLLTARRTFARVQATTRSAVDLALRIEGAKPSTRWTRATVRESMQLQRRLNSVGDIDRECEAVLRAAYEQNR